MVKILAVDDDPDITISVKEGLERQGFEVDIYNDPVRAVGEFRPNTYRLALLDMSMPGMGGFEVFREIRKRDPGIKI
ncbi:MAG: response regulator, partial [Patescibacteria group bacterium]|nr:response regulator [Patescibacteria group bacterium]